MFGSLSWLWSKTNIKDEWDTWEIWQSSQPFTHYSKSDVYQYYLLSHPQFQPPQFSATTGPKSIYYIYCFGEFAALLINPSCNPNHLYTTINNIYDYCNLLLDFYDTCKGTTRRITGDPPSISVLREVLRIKSTVPLHAHDFHQYNYDYTILHGHTVAQYSLSTLIMRFIGNYMHQISPHGNYPFISSAKCEKAYRNSSFGNTSKEVIVKTQPINIPKKSIIEEGRSYSWPRDSITCSRCQICNRVSENLWGDFNSCLDCHMKRICSKCSIPAVVIGSDNLPKCSLHQNDH